MNYMSVQCEGMSEIDIIVDFDQLCSATDHEEAVDCSVSSLSVDFDSLSVPQPSTSSPVPKLLDSSVTIDFGSSTCSPVVIVATPVIRNPISRKRLFCNECK